MASPGWSACDRNFRPQLGVSVAMRWDGERFRGRGRARRVAWCVGGLGGLGCQLLAVLGGLVVAGAAIARAPVRAPSGEARRFFPATRVSPAAALGVASTVVLNDRGQGAVLSTAPNSNTRAPGRVQIAGVLSSGQVLTPTLIPLTPGTISAGSFSAVLGPTGRLVVGTVTFDGTLVSDDPHSDPCCSEIALGSWQLGQAPPVPQLLVPAGTKGHAIDDQALGPPQLAIQSGSVTALWAQGFPDSFAGPGHLQRAAGPLDGPFVSGPFDAASSGGAFDLENAPGGGVVADYSPRADTIVTLAGRDGNQLRRTHSRHLMGFARGDTTGLGLVTDAHANGLLAYRLTRSRLIVGAYRRARGAFGAFRSLVWLPSGSSNLMLAAGGRRRALLAATDRQGHLRVALGRFTARFPPAQDLGPVSATGVGSINVDSHGRSLVSWDRFSHVNRNGTYAYTVQASTAGPSGQFKSPRRISPRGQNCTLANIQTPVAYSVAGRALIAIQCDFTYSNPDGTYRFIRYQP